MSGDRGIKVILLGESGVGKTNLIRVAMGKNFDPNENSTLTSSFFEEQIAINNKNYLYCLWDTAGQEAYRSLNKIFIKEAKIVIIVFAINFQYSFEQIDFWINYTKDILGEDNYILALVGNKADLYESQQISDEEIKKKVDELKIKYKLTSASEDSLGFKEFLNDLLKDYIDKFGASEIKEEKDEPFKIEKEKTEDNNGDNKNQNNNGKKKCC
jgi:small GTP-binding protein